MLRVFQKQKNDVTIDFLVRVAISIYFCISIELLTCTWHFVYISI